VASCVSTGAISVLLEAVRRRDRDATSWEALQWGLLGLKSPILPKEPLTDGYHLAIQISWLEGICTIGELLGPRLFAAGKREEAAEMLRRSKEGFQRMRREEDASRVAVTMDHFLHGNTV